MPLSIIKNIANRERMEIFFTILIMTLVVSLSGVFTRVLPFQLPLPLMQIAVGALLAWPTFGLHVEFDPELFLVLFIPPLLFADGWKTPTREFLEHGREIFGLALALEDGKLLAAVNQTLVSFDHPLTAGDEVAFFPPVTGG